MKTTIVFLVLASIFGLMYCSDHSLAGFPRRSHCRTCCPLSTGDSHASPVVAQEPEDLELRALLTKRRDQLENYYQVVSQRVHVGHRIDP